MKSYNLEERLIGFAMAIIKLADKMPDSYIGKHLQGQLYHSGTAPALDYGEAQGAESKADFVHKMQICLKELRETQICIKIINRANLITVVRCTNCFIRMRRVGRYFYSKPDNGKA